ncbi:MAG: tryptophan synthase subunit alpha [Ichthyobacteriaceae bacterium]|nr:tryptophan synthase subunit alpha [Ichthyobacteriaceae bacterium]
MNKLQELFKNKKEDILSIYFTAGYPELNTSGDIIKNLEKSGVDFIEVGMPFSDPMADGPTIQETSEVALKNGMNLDVYFNELKAITGEVDIPLIAMGYVNQMIRFGTDKFLTLCKESGISGLILPDLPLNVYEKDFRAKFEEYNMVNVFLITPQTSEDRIKEIDEASNAFIYMVSSASTTGSKSNIADSQLEYFQRMKDMELNNPLVIGFGISNNDTYTKACKYASGAIIGSAFVKAIKNGVTEKVVSDFINMVKG